MNIIAIIGLVALASVSASAKCTKPTDSPPQTTDSVIDDTSPPDTPTPDTPAPETTTPDIPPPELWPSGRFSLMMAGDECPDFFPFRKGYIYQDTEDNRNINSWPVNSPGLKGFEEGSIHWDDENYSNMNRRVGRAPAAILGADTTLFYCCREDGPDNVGISLPVTKPFYMYRFTGQCQRVRDMTTTEEVIRFDDEDNNNQNNKTGAYPMDTGSQIDHHIHLCLYRPR